MSGSCWRERGYSRGRGGAADGAQLTLVQAQYIADVVEPGGVRQLRVEQRDDVAPRREGPRLFIHAVLARQLRDEVAGNKFTNLFQCAKLRAGRFRAHVFLLAAEPQWFCKENVTHGPAQFLIPMGWL